MSNNKRIGNQAERKFSKLLSLWMSKGESDDLVWRDLSSGARFTTRLKEGKNTELKSDLVPLDLSVKPFFDLFFVDSKSIKELNFNFINKKNQKTNRILNEWKSVKEHCPANMIPLMFCEGRDRKTRDFLVSPLSVWMKNTSGQYVKLSNMGIMMKIIDLEEFFEQNEWLEFVKCNVDMA